MGKRKSKEKSVPFQVLVIREGDVDHTVLLEKRTNLEFVETMERLIRSSCGKLGIEEILLRQTSYDLQLRTDSLVSITVISCAGVIADQREVFAVVSKELEGLYPGFILEIGRQDDSMSFNDFVNDVLVPRGESFFETNALLLKTISYATSPLKVRSGL